MTADAPAPSPRRANSKRTHRLILEKAIDVLAEEPQATLEQIAQQIGVNRSTLHRHFPRREDLIASLSEQVIAEVDDLNRRCRAEGGTAAEQIERILRGNALLGGRYRFFLDHWKPILGRPDVYATEASWIALLEAAQAEGTFRDDVSVPWMRRVIAATMRAGYEAIDEGAMTLPEAADLVAETVMSALRPLPA